MICPDCGSAMRGRQWCAVCGWSPVLDVIHAIPDRAARRELISAFGATAQDRDRWQARCYLACGVAGVLAWALVGLALTC